MIKRAVVTALLVVLAYGYGLADKRIALPEIGHTSGALIPVMTIDELLAQIDQGNKVIFIDAREPAEFEETHLPGALNLTLREVAKTDANRFSDADIVVTYCLKDFRGFELGRALQTKGLQNIRMMKEHGINGWKKNNLPVAGRLGIPEQVALARMQVCAQDKNQCLQKMMP